MDSLRLLFILATCLFIQTAWGQDSCENLSVIGGHNVHIRDVPFIAAIIENDEAVCAGTIVHESFILTAASCASDGTQQKVLVGTARLNGGAGTYYDVAKEICHYDFDKDTMNNDICLLKLKTRIRLGRRVAKVQLPQSNLYVADGTLLNVTGWGSVDSTGNKFPDRLKQTTVPKSSNECCNEIYDDVTDSMFCAGKQGHDACEGDGGAPLTMNNVLVGLYSSGPQSGCGSKKPSIYTKVSSYLSWISRMIEYNS